MTDALLRRGQFALAPVQRHDVDEALALCARHPVQTVVPTSHLETARNSGVVPTGLWAVRDRHLEGRGLAGVIWAGANLTVVLASGGQDPDDVRAEVAGALIERLPRPAAMVGEQELTLDLWGRLEPWWGPARELRSCQVSMAIAHDPEGVEPARLGDVTLESVRPSTLSDYDDILPAAVHMFVGEVGYDPLKHGRAAYEDRLSGLVRSGRSFVQFGTVGGKRSVVFKAEVGVVGGGVAQIQGVWVHPDLRARGVAAAGMADVVRLVRELHAPTVSLYVNDFNVPAIKAYEAAGFARVGTFATVMF